jgi:hypothetical protein
VLLIVSLLLVVVLLIVVFARRVEGAPVEGVSVANVVVDVPVEDINVIDVGDVGIEDVTEVAEVELETLYQVLSSRSQRAEGPESKGRKPRSKPRSQGKKTYVSCPSTVITIEEETEEELLARKFDEQLYGRRASKRKANYWDLKPVGRRPRDNKEKGDFRQDRRLKASRQKAVVESRTAYSPLVPIYVVGIREGLIP